MNSMKETVENTKEHKNLKHIAKFQETTKDS